jgi:hypothetical protein
MSDTTTFSDGLDGHDRRYVRYDPESNRQMSTTLALTVADLEGVSPTDLDPLAYSIDPGEIDALVSEYEPTGVAGDLSFQYAGYEILVHPCGLAELSTVEGTNA